MINMTTKAERKVNAMNVSDRIQELRKSRGISQEELANALGVSRQAVSKWESGQSFPELDNIVALSDYFGVSADHILKGTDTLQVIKTRTPIPSKPRTNPIELLRLYIEKKRTESETEEKEVLFQLAMTQKQKSVLAMAIFICSAVISVMSAYNLGVFFDSDNSFRWAPWLGTMMIGFGIYHAAKRLSAKEPPFIIRYINKASFGFAVAFLTAVHSVFNNMDYLPNERIGFAVIYILGAASVYAGILLYRKMKKFQSENDDDLPQQITK